MEGPCASVVDEERVVLGAGSERMVLQYVEQIQLTVPSSISGLCDSLEERSDQSYVVRKRPSGVEVGESRSGGGNSKAQGEI